MTSRFEFKSGRRSRIKYNDCSQYLSCNYLPLFVALLITPLVATNTHFAECRSDENRHRHVMYVPTGRTDPASTWTSVHINNLPEELLAQTYKAEVEKSFPHTKSRIKTTRRSISSTAGAAAPASIGGAGLIYRHSILHEVPSGPNPISNSRPGTRR